MLWLLDLLKISFQIGVLLLFINQTICLIFAWLVKKCYTIDVYDVFGSRFVLTIWNLDQKRLVFKWLFKMAVKKSGFPMVNSRWPPMDFKWSWLCQHASHSTLELWIFPQQVILFRNLKSDFLRTTLFSHFHSKKAHYSREELSCLKLRR